MNKIFFKKSLFLFSLISVFSMVPFAHGQTNKKPAQKTEPIAKDTVRNEDKEDSSPQYTNRESSPFSLNASTSAGSNSYRSLTLNGRIRLTSMHTVFASALFSSYDGLKSQAYQAGFEVRTSRELKLTFAGRYLREPNEISGYGASARADYLLSSLWDGTFMTVFFGEFEWTRYSQKRVARSFFLNDPIAQYALTAGLYQQLTSLLDGSISYTQYLYSDDSKKISNAVENRSILSRHFSGLVYGFPRYGWNADIGLHPISALDLGAFYSWIRLASNNQTSQTYGGTISMGIAPTLHLVGQVSQTKVQSREADWVYGIGLQAKLN